MPLNKTCPIFEFMFIFYLQIRKVNCNIRPDSVCCQSVADDRIDVVDDAQEDYTDAEGTANKDGDNLIQIASNIHEVVVKPNGEPVQASSHVTEATEVKVDDASSSTSSSSSSTTSSSTSSTTESTSKASQEEIPSFCLKLKFNCKLFAFHTCCKYQLPVSSSASG